MSNPRFIRHIQGVRGGEQSCSETCPSGDKLPAAMSIPQPADHGDRDEPINIMALVKKAKGPDGKYRAVEKYVFLFTDNQCGEVKQCLGRFANNPDLSFTWWNAAKLAKRVREIEGAMGGKEEMSGR